MKKCLVLVSFILLIFALSGISSAKSMDHKMMDKGKMSLCRVNATDDLRLAMRKLWEDHIVYTRNYIISSLADLEDASAIAARLLGNQKDIGNAIKPYYGEAAGNQLAALLKDHILIAAEVVKAAKSGNSEDLAKADKKWHANADDIAVFLSKANPNWTKKDLTNMLYKHLDLTTGEVVSRLHKNWEDDISYYDKGHSHMLMFADALTCGIVKQFPDKFKK